MKVFIWYKVPGLTKGVFNNPYGKVVAWGFSQDDAIYKLREAGTVTETVLATLSNTLPDEVFLDPGPGM